MSSSFFKITVNAALPLPTRSPFVKPVMVMLLTATDANDGAAFVNVCKSAERLPLTGGLTTRNFLVGGFVVGLLAVFAGLGIHEWWNKQRRKEQLLE